MWRGSCTGNLPRPKVHPHSCNVEVLRNGANYDYGPCYFRLSQERGEAPIVAETQLPHALGRPCKHSLIYVETL
ncbi:hypothetical protein TNCV_5079061 [Trichonephila clavipes]|nr:hypothetical protein TNCV_5079061 [Trichonephila clavipes]